MTRRFVIVGRKATASPEFSLIDIAGTSGRLDVLLRGLRAALLVSHGVRRDTRVYLVLLGGARAPRVVRVDGESAKFLRPDERALATLVQKTLAHDGDAPGFVEVRPGVALAAGGIEAVIADIGSATPLILEEGGRDVRTLDDAALGSDVAIFVGGHDGFDAEVRAKLDALGATAISVGPVSVHADDAITIVANELDRRGGGA
jgi:tRNA (pseudouridine54-N1)-methyltransferase